MTAFAVYARSCERLRIGLDRSSVPLAGIFTTSVCEALRRCKLEPPEAGDLSERVGFSQSLEDTSGKVVGIVLCSHSFSTDIATLLNAEQRCVSDFWKSTKFKEDPLVIVTFVKAVALQRPRLVHEHMGRSHSTGVFMQLTHSSAQDVLEERVLSGISVRDLLGVWRATHGVDVASVGFAMCMPTPHAHLCAVGSWRSWGFPVPRAQRVRSSCKI